MIYLLLLTYLLLTIITEGMAVSVIFKKRIYVYYSLLCNLLTNPALNLLLLLTINVLGVGAYFPALILLEIMVVFVEACVYRYLCKFKFLKSLVLSAFLNILSFSAGFYLNRILF